MSTDLLCIYAFIIKNTMIPAIAVNPILQSNVKSITVIKRDSKRPFKVIITTRVATSASASIVLVVILVIVPKEFSLKYPIGM